MPAMDMISLALDLIRLIVYWISSDCFEMRDKMNLQMDEKRKGKLISFSVAWREEELDRVWDCGRGRHSYFLDLRQREPGHIVPQSVIVVEDEDHGQGLSVNNSGERQTGPTLGTVLYEVGAPGGHFYQVLTAGRSGQPTGETEGAVRRGVLCWPGARPVEVTVAGGGVHGCEVSGTSSGHQSSQDQ